MLRRVVDMTHAEGFEVSWIDSTILAEHPRLAPFIGSMKDTIARAGILQALLISRQRQTRAWACRKGEAWQPMQSACLISSDFRTADILFPVSGFCLSG